MRPESRFLGIDDGPFENRSKEVLVVATYFRGGKALDAVLSTTVKKDGDDATEKLIELIKKSRYSSNLSAIFLDGIAVAGFNVIDIQELHKQTGTPVIVIMRKQPDREAMFEALKKMQQPSKISLIEKAGTIHEHKSIFFQCAGIEETKAREVIDLSTISSPHF